MLWFTARDTPNGGFVERGRRLETAPDNGTDRAASGRPSGRAGDGRGWKSRRVEALFSFVSKTRQLIFVFAPGRIWP